MKCNYATLEKVIFPNVTGGKTWREEMGSAIYEVAFSIDEYIWWLVLYYFVILYIIHMQ